METFVIALCLTGLVASIYFVLDAFDQFHRVRLRRQEREARR